MSEHESQGLQLANVATAVEAAPETIALETIAVEVAAVEAAAVEVAAVEAAAPVTTPVEEIAIESVVIAPVVAQAATPDAAPKEVGPNETTPAEPVLDVTEAARKAKVREKKPKVDQPSDAAVGFRDLALSDDVQLAIEKSGYVTPTEVQTMIIPHMLDGRDVLAQSQTGTGKTAAFALPILSRLDVHQRYPQVLVLAPTRELAIQVSKSFSTYGACLSGLNVATIYGGQSYDPQLRQLQRGVQIVVGTPGRVIDHINRGTLDVSRISCLVLDEADEMLNMGFLEDVQFVLNKTPANRQIALFSATLPGPIQSIAEQYLNDPERITIKKKTITADNIRQRALFVMPRDKVHALCRILAAEETDGVIVFTKTKASTLAVAESLSRKGLSAVALNGDMAQAARERTVDQFKSGQLDVLVATDVAARGLDVSRVSHVFNFDAPHDTESYIHRVGRTGRAGRNGEAFIFLSNAQRGKLRLIERATNQKIEVVQLPTTQHVNELRITRFKQQITEVTAAEDLTMFKSLIEDYAAETGKPIEMVAAALAHISQQGQPFLEAERPKRERRERTDEPRQNRFERDGDEETFGQRPSEGSRRPRKLGPPEPGMERYRIEVGRRDGVKPGNIVGAVANEAGIDGQFIGPILIHDSHSTVDLPEGMPRDIYQSLRRTWVLGKQLQLARADEAGDESGDREASTRQHHPKNHRHAKPRGKQMGPGKQTGPGGFSRNKPAQSKKVNAGQKRKKRKAPAI